MNDRRIKGFVCNAGKNIEIFFLPNVQFRWIYSQQNNIKINFNKPYVPFMHFENLRFVLMLLITYSEVDFFKYCCISIS